MEMQAQGADVIDVGGESTRPGAEQVAAEEEIARILTALEDLPTDQKEVIVLGVFQDLSYAQMEEITGTKAVTLRSRMFHGLKKLASMIGGEQP